MAGIYLIMSVELGCQRIYNWLFGTRATIRSRKNSAAMRSRSCQDKIDIMNRYNEISMLMCEPMDDNEMDKLLNEQGNLQDILDSQNIWDLDNGLKWLWMHFVAHQQR